MLGKCYKSEYATYSKTTHTHTHKIRSMTSFSLLYGFLNLTDLSDHNHTPENYLSQSTESPQTGNRSTDVTRLI